MFDALKGLNLSDLMSKAQDMRQQMEKMQAELAKKTVTADAGGGMVQATVSGKLELVKLKIDRQKVDVNDTELLEDVIIAAVNAAQQRAGEMMRDEMKKATADMGIPPGLLGGGM